MQNEISSGTMLGIVLIALAAVIGLGFGVFSIAKGVSNEGVVSVQDNLTTVSDSAFSDYDNKIVTGTQVIAAYKNFQGKPVGLLISTQALTKGVKNNPNHDTYVFKIGTTSYVNYNALLASNPAGATGALVDKAAAGTALNNSGTAAAATETDNGLFLKEPNVLTANGFAISTTTGKVLFDDNIGGFSKAGNCEYISTSAKFETRLIKDASGQNVGIAFTQLSK